MEMVDPLSQNGFGHHDSGTVTGANQAAGSGREPPNRINYSIFSDAVKAVGSSPQPLNPINYSVFSNFGHASGTVADVDEVAGLSPQPPNRINYNVFANRDFEIVEVANEKARTRPSFEIVKQLRSHTISSFPSTSSPSLKQDFEIVEVADETARTRPSFQFIKQLRSRTISSFPSTSSPSLKRDFETVEVANETARTRPQLRSPTISSFPSTNSPSSKRDFETVEVANETARTRPQLQSPTISSFSSTNSLSLSSKKIENQVIRNSLYLAALRGDWDEAKRLLKGQSPDSVLTDRGDTALHVAAAAQQTSFVEELVKILSPSQLNLPNEYGCKAICFAAISGTLRIAKVMVDKNRWLLVNCGYNNCIPLTLALTHKRKDMVYYLSSLTSLESLPSSEKFKLLLAAILGDYYDIGLKIIKLEPELALKRTEDNQTALHLLARKPHAIGSRSQERIWKKYNIFFGFKRIYTKAWMKTLAYQMVEIMWKTVLQSGKESDVLDFINTPSRLLHDAAEVGNVEFLIVLIRLYPDAIWNLDSGYRSIFHVAVENRQESVFRLIYEIGGLKDIIANLIGPDNVSILHLAACQASPNHLDRVSGPALQMQRELQWFKEVEKIAAPYFSEVKNTSSKERPLTVKGEISCLTMPELFTDKHRDLQKQGEEWMKSTSNSCMLVATLVSTVVFAAAFTIPGGNQGSTGIPVFENKNLFSVFVIADAAALFSSSISIMMFLSILTSRFAQEDFLNSLPWRLLIGLATLFISLACMVVAFSATFFMFYETRKSWVPWAVMAMSVAPVTCFTILQYKLWADTFRATFWSKYLFKPRKPSLKKSAPTIWNTFFDIISRKSKRC